jgi:hypothetical protein
MNNYSEYDSSGTSLLMKTTIKKQRPTKNNYVTEENLVRKRGLTTSEKKHQCLENPKKRP